MPKNKCADRGKKCQWPELEKGLKQWREDQRKSGYIVTRNLLRMHAKVLAKRHNIANFCTFRPLMHKLSETARLCYTSKVKDFGRFGRENC